MFDFRNVVRTVLHRYGFDIRRFAATDGKSINVLDLAVRSRLNSAGPFFVLQIGAHDGKMDDPINALITKYKLPGLLVEPMPEFFEKLCTNYTECPGLMFENCAISSEDGEREMFRIRAGTYSRPGIDGMASFFRAVPLRAKRILPDVQRNIESITVRTMTMESLFEKHRITAVDLLQIDTEGFDYEIVKLALRAKIIPQIIHYEHIHLSPADQVDCRRLLMSHNYRFVDVDADTLALRED